MSKKDTKQALLRDIINQRLEHVGFEIKHKKDRVAREIHYLKNPTGITSCSWSGSEHEVLYNLICEVANQLAQQNLLLVEQGKAEHQEFTVEWNDKEKFLKEHFNITQLIQIPVTNGVAVLFIREMIEKQESKND